jgi:alkanesulfonate monooxygenase SsuD/methylene tetrahydromethanopterin reductase-like flavin-dependent oxidoreductase (luciferase family)
LFAGCGSHSGYLSHNRRVEGKPLEVGVGLPSSVPGTRADTLLEWARRADQGPFSSLGVVDRISFDCYEPLTLLAAAATATSRVKLVTMVAISPLRTTAVLAKQAATIASMSNGRLVLGLAIGARRDDYDAAGVDHSDRGRRFTQQLIDLRSYWENDAVGPRPIPPQGPIVLAGGSSDAAFFRMARYADGYVHGGGPPRAFARAASVARAAWAECARPSRPQLWGQGYFALGDDAAERGEAYMRSYYEFTGPFVQRIVDVMLRTPQDVVQFVRGYAEAGCGELVLLPAVADIDQLDRLADVLTGALTR